MDTWTEWNLWNSTDVVWEPHVVCSHIFEFNTHLMQDRLSGAVYEVSMNYFDDEVVPAS
jgi:hypothetical protein